MEISHVQQRKEHIGIDNSVQSLSILPLDSSFDSKNECTNQGSEPGPPHEALFLALAYLPVFELLAMSEVCIALRDAVKKDVLPWLDIYLERPLNSRLSDEILIQITSRTNGGLKTLSLINCTKITDDGLQRVTEKNPFISKIHIPACTSLTPEGIIRAVNTLSQHHNSLKSLRINGIYNLKKEHLATLRSYLQMNPVQQKPQRILYFHHRTFSASRNNESDLVIDVDICPKCSEVRMVFDCPRETCKKGCRGCNFCIPRCEECGVCVDTGMEEVACADNLCLDCWLHLPKCNFCNKPYCSQHAYMGCRSPASTGFLCNACYMDIIYSINDVM